MVEATLILPVVTLSVMAVINIVIFLYSEVEMNAKMHVAGTSAAGEYAGTCKILEHVPTGIAIDKKIKGVGHVYQTNSNIGFRKSGLIKDSVTKNLSAETYEVDEKKMIRYRDFLK